MVEKAVPESGSVLPRDLWCLPREGLAHFCSAVCRKRGLWLCRQKPKPERRACLSRKPLQGCSAWSSPPSVLWHLPRCPLGSGSEHGWSPSPQWAGEQGRGQASGASEDLLSGLEARSRERDDECLLPRGSVVGEEGSERCFALLRVLEACRREGLTRWPGPGL